MKMNRNFYTVLYKIQYIVSNLCKDVILQRKWISELEWFQNFEYTKHVEYFNYAPEAMMDLRWHKLGIVLDTCISSQPYSDWEKRIVDIFLAKDKGDDLPDITDVFALPINADTYEEEHDSDYEDPYADDIEGQRRLARQEKAASRHAERRG
jgi:hypothetical protein